MSIQAVLDTSVLLSAERHQLLFYAHKRIYTFLRSSFLVGECVRVRDEPLLAAALVGKAGYVVSWNIHDFPPSGAFAGVWYLTPPDFYEILYAEHPRRKLKEAFEASG